MADNPRTGSSLDEMLREDGIYEETKARAIKSVLARKLTLAMADQNLTKASIWRPVAHSSIDCLIRTMKASHLIP